MYKEALKQNIPFFEIYKWIEKELDKVYLNYLYGKDKCARNVINSLYIDDELNLFLAE